MPNTYVALPETEQSIFRPIVIGIVEQIQHITKMKAAQIYFPNEDKKVATSGATVDTKAKVDKFTEFEGKRKTEIVVEEELDPEEIQTTFFDGKEYPPVFQDRYIGITLCPVYAKAQVSVQFIYGCGSKTEAMRWLQEMRMAISRLREYYMHAVEYQYSLDRRYMDLIKLIFGMREQQGGYGDTFDQYWAKNSTPRLTYIGDLAGENAIMAVAERQTEIIGKFDFEGLPAKPTKNEQTGFWEIAFEYKFNYSKPIGINLRYPIIVHNQTMPLEYVSFTSREVRPLAKGPVSLSRTQAAELKFRADSVMDRIKAEDGVLMLPDFDDWQPDVRLKLTSGIIQILLEIDPTNLRALMSLQDMGDVVLDDDILQFLLGGEYTYLNQPYRSIFNVGLYRNGLLQDFRTISVDNQLNITSTVGLDIRSQYRIRFSVVNDISFVDPKAIVRLRQFPKLVYKVVKAINRAFRENPEMQQFNSVKHLSEIEFNAIYRGLLGMEPGIGSKEIGWKELTCLRKYCISPELLHRIKTQNRSMKSTQIYGILAYNKTDPNFKQVPLQTC
jgi:hypothetical protein